MAVRLIPYLVMNGNAKEAIQFYESALEAQIVAQMSFGDMPENPEFPLPPEAKSLLSHALLKVGEAELMFSDTFPGQPHQAGNQVTICISTDDPGTSKRFFEALEHNGQVQMPLQETFFSPAYGSVIDQFGVTFQIFTEAGKQK
ncbi:VOC family protein [Paenibacillus sp. y28]|uniref:VOC family protein n=1 Tax=Paenibacillus sp. y28 TaxID=3129110 RepID=UPI003017D6C7